MNKRSLFDAVRLAHCTYISNYGPQNRPLTEAEKIQDEVQRQVAKCTCVHRFKVFQVGEGKYRVRNLKIVSFSLLPIRLPSADRLQ